MPTFDASSASCTVFTFKEGLLSAVAHDLEIAVTNFSIEVSDDGGSVHAHFDPSSLRVVSARVDGRPTPGTLSDKDKAKIAASIRDDVLHVKRHPGPIELTSKKVTVEGDAWRIEGTLRIAGRSRDVTIEARTDGAHRVARVRIHQPDYGIKPFSAMLGALKIKPDVEVEVRVPAS